MEANTVIRQVNGSSVVVDGRSANADRKKSKGIQFERVFSKKGVNPFDAVKWVMREALITNERGEVIFKQENVEMPESWSQMAANVVASKYFRGTLGTSDRENSVKQLISRVADTITAWGRKDGYFKTDDQAAIFNHELTTLLVEQYGAFNSPVWFNVGVEERPQCSACFILSVDDSMDSLLKLQHAEGMLFKFGSGAGTNLSNIRSSKEKLSGGGIPSGPVSFMRGYDAWAGTIKSGGKTRRAAKMQILDVDHPDIQQFVSVKRHEEEKAWALINEGYDGGFNVPGGAYDSVFFQNSNLSVRVTDEFMRAATEGKKFATRRRTDGGVCEYLDAKELLHEIALGTYVCGDPGIQFDTTINDWNTCPSSGRINASNPCSEYMHLDNSACNLASLNLLKFLLDDGCIDVERYLHAVDIFITAQDIIVDNAGYPTDEIAKSASKYRQLGLGYANLGALLMAKGLAYDSDEGRMWAAELTALMCGEAYLMSTYIAEELGAFVAYAENAEGMQRVIAKHAENAKKLPRQILSSTLTEKAADVWQQAMARSKLYGYRNSQTTVIAPTGTIAFLMDCDTTGIEPDIGLVKYKKLVGGGMLKIVNQSVPRALRVLGYDEGAIEKILSYIDERDCIEGCEQLSSKHLPVFDCAFKPAKGERFIQYMGHVRMMAAVQPFISGAISKTVNMPESATVEEIMQTYIEAWKLGLKAIAIYRNNSKRSQPLATAKDGHEVGTEKAVETRILRRHLPDERQAITHKFSIAGHEGYITVGVYEDGSPGEIFIVMAKEGSTLSGVMDAFATSISLALQYGVPLSALVKKFSHMRFDPSGFTKNKQIPMAKSVLDYIFRWLAAKFLSSEEQRAVGVLQAGDVGVESAKVQNSQALDNTAQRGATESESSVGGNSAIGFAIKENPPKGQLVSRFDGVADNSVEMPSHGHARATSVSFAPVSEDAPPCTICGAFMVRQGACYRCLNCGSQSGCS
ncbi:MAG: vitamin B12-dependent ribonucleotide reductase [Deltaproteobacteria bacterium]|nr:vitamin B12-dependent ribonucleotide reductase [Deltaproteobacteria bacterium]